MGHCQVGLSPLASPFTAHVEPGMPWGVPATVAATLLVEELWFERLEDGDGEWVKKEVSVRPFPFGSATHGRRLQAELKSS